MFKPSVRVTVEISPGDYREVRKELGGTLVKDTFSHVDIPDVDASGFGRMLCTNPVEIRRVMVARKDAAKMISVAITDALLDAMGVRDTEMGYKRHNAVLSGAANEVKPRRDV